MAAVVLPPAQPTAILRGHRSPVQAVVFVRLAGSDGDGDGNGNGMGAAMAADSRLATGDSDGFVVLWDLAIVRPRAVWRAHTNSILGLAGWDDERLIVTHGRDHRLVVWQVGVADEARLSTVLPLDSGKPLSGPATAAARPQPRIVHVLEVNTMNFCSFASCRLASASAVARADGQGGRAPPAPTAERLVAVPNTLTLEAVDIYHLPSQRRINTVTLGAKEGMIMALALVRREAASSRGALVLVAAFENGVVMAATLDAADASGPATVCYRAKAHSQPILALDVAPDHSYFLTSAADAVIAKHPVPEPPGVGVLVQQPSAPSPPPPQPPRPGSLLAAALSREAAAAGGGAPALNSASPSAAVPPASPGPATEPLQTLNTKHAGQQGLRIRGDGRLFATAGWDSRVRVYAARTMKEVAVLKWHQAGCFAVAFAPVAGQGSEAGSGPDASAASAAPTAPGALSSTSSLVGTAAPRQISVKERRLRHAVAAHWLAAGSKDGKISLWDIF